jgi:hypothetical protein
MILVQVFLVIGFLLIMFWFLTKPSNAQVKAWKRLAVVGLFVLSIFTVLVPSSADDVAHFVGVYSGANLLLYILAVSFVAFVLNQFVYNGGERERLIAITRKLAILEAQNRKLEAELKEAQAASDRPEAVPEH